MIFCLPFTCHSAVRYYRDLYAVYACLWKGEEKDVWNMEMRSCERKASTFFRRLADFCEGKCRWEMDEEMDSGNGENIEYMYVMPSRYVFCFHKCSMNIFRFVMGWLNTCDEIPLSSDYGIIHLNSMPRRMKWNEMRWEADNDFDFVIIIFNIVNEFWSHSIFFQDDMFILIW